MKGQSVMIMCSKSYVYHVHGQALKIQISSDSNIIFLMAVNETYIQGPV